MNKEENVTVGPIRHGNLNKTKKEHTRRLTNKRLKTRHVSTYAILAIRGRFPGQQDLNRQIQIKRLDWNEGQIPKAFKKR